MTSYEVQQAVLKALERFGCNAKEVVPVYDLQSDLGLDSTEVVELAALVRTQCGLKAQRVNLRSIRTVADLAAEVKALLDQASAG